jgi:hypothetical protein
MKKLLFAFASFLIIAASANAQEKIMKTSKTTVGIAANVGKVITNDGSSSFDYKLVAGGDFQVDIPATTGLKITASVGYQNFAYEIRFGTSPLRDHISYIPLLAGAKFDLSSKFYGHAQLGYAFSTVKDGQGSFTYAPSIGYMLKDFDIGIKYLGLSNKIENIGAIVARLAYIFK